MKANLTVSIDVDVLKESQEKLKGNLANICEIALRKALLKHEKAN